MEQSHRFANLPICHFDVMSRVFAFALPSRDLVWSIALLAFLSQTGLDSSITV